MELLNLDVGFEFDRYGGKYIDGAFIDNGQFISPIGSSFESRALPTSYQTLPYKKYRVVKKIENVIKGKSIPWFGKTGNGTQFKMPVEMKINNLIKNGFIIEI